MAHGPLFLNQGGPAHRVVRAMAIRPLALGLHAQRHLLEGDLRCQRSTNHSRICAGSTARSVHSRACVAHPGGPEPSLPERYQTAVCEVSSTVRVVPLYQATAAVPGPPDFSRRPFNRSGPADVLGPFIEGGVQAPGDELTGCANDWQQWSRSRRSRRRPPAPRDAAAASGAVAGSLPRPVGEFFMAASALPVVACRGRQHGEKGQGPITSRPGDLAQPHQGDPAGRGP